MPSLILYKLFFYCLIIKNLQKIKRDYDCLLLEDETALIRLLPFFAAISRNIMLRTKKRQFLKLFAHMA